MHAQEQQWSLSLVQKAKTLQRARRHDDSRRKGERNLKSLLWDFDEELNAVDLEHWEGILYGQPKQALLEISPTFKLARDHSQ